MKAPTDGEVSLREITSETLRSILKLQVRVDQEGSVASNATSIAQAYFEDKAWFRAIYAGATPVGFVMLHVDTEESAYYLWRFMIDAKHQGKGYGAQAIKLVIEHVKSNPNATELLTSYVPGEGSPLGFYNRNGFEHTGKEVHGDPEMRLKLR